MELRASARPHPALVSDDAQMGERTHRPEGVSRELWGPRRASGRLHLRDSVSSEGVLRARAGRARWKNTRRAAMLKTRGTSERAGRGGRVRARLCTGLDPRPASKTCFLTVMTFLPAAFPVLPGRPWNFHAAVSRTTALQPALGTQCFLASPPSQGATEQLAWQRPGSRTPAAGLEPGACGPAGWGAGAPGPEGSPSRSSLRAFSEDAVPSPAAP